MNTQFRKGVIELCVLSLISQKDRYGFEIVQRIAEHTNINEGTIYPILRRLTLEGFFNTYLVESRGGPARKYYSITPTGQHHFMQLLKDWENTTTMVSKLTKPIL
ncbi:MAG: PadR family transcriptional regulator [Oscillospiraceae bacterium]